MSKIAFIVTTRGEESIDDLLETFEKSKSQEEGRFFIVFNACKEEFVERTIEKHPLIKPLINDLNPEKLPQSINRGLRAARQLGWNAAVMTELNSDLKFHLTTHTQALSAETINKVGMLRENYHLSHFWLEYWIRARAAGITLTIEPALIQQELSSTSQWDWLRFGQQWRLPDSLQPEEFWSYIQRTNWEWKPEMFVE